MNNDYIKDILETSIEQRSILYHSLQPGYTDYTKGIFTIIQNFTQQSNHIH